MECAACLLLPPASPSFTPLLEPHAGLVRADQSVLRVYGRRPIVSCPGKLLLCVCVCARDREHSAAEIVQFPTKCSDRIA